MKAVILAAGVGSRLGKPFPKSLSMLPTGERILGRQIKIFQKFGIEEIYVVIGFKKNLIMEEFPQVYFKYNPLYYITNTAKSLCCVLENIDDDVIWCNGDVVFDDKVMEIMLGSDKNAVAVDRKKCAEEEVKYRADDSSNILEISKSVSEAHGEAMGINIIRKNDISSFVQALASCNDQDYFERGMELAIEQSVNFTAVDVSAYRCIEVDFEEDLLEARLMFTN